MIQFLYDKFPIFNLLIKFENNYLYAIEFCKKDTILFVDRLDNKKFDFIKKLIRQLDCYLNDGKFKFDIPIVEHGSLFQQKLYARIRQIRSGTTESYLSLAHKFATSTRGIGNSCGRNKIPLFIPCHRVIAVNGNLGGFMNNKVGSFGLLVKKWLLKHEQIN